MNASSGSRSNERLPVSGRRQWPFFLIAGCIAVVVGLYLYHLFWGTLAVALVIGLAYIAYDTCLNWYLLGSAWRGVRAAGADECVGLSESPRQASEDIHEKTHRERSSTREAAVSHPITVLIPAYNEAQSLPATLAALLPQLRRVTPADGESEDGLSAPTEVAFAKPGQESDVSTTLPTTAVGIIDQVLIVDDGSTDDTAVQLQAFFQTQPLAVGLSDLAPGVRLLRHDNVGKAASLNAALALVTTPCVLTLDADTLLAPGSLAAIAGAFADPQTRVACGILMPDRPVSGWRAKWMLAHQQSEFLRSFLYRLAWSRHNSLLLVSGACAAFHTSDLRAIGGFRADSWVEDYDVMYRLHAYQRDQRRRPCSVAIVPAAWATTDAPTTAASFLRQRRRWFGGFVETLWTHRHFVGRSQWGLLGYFHLPVKMMDAVQPLLLVLLLLSALILLLLGHNFSWAVLAIVGLKWLLDTMVNTWLVTWFRRWTTAPSLPLGKAGWLHLTEGLGFQWLRLTAACWGWLSVWQRSRRQHSHRQPGWTPDREMLTASSSASSNRS